MESVLDANCRMLLLYMPKRKFWIEEKNQRINKFSFRYLFNPTLHKKNVFREQVKSCLNNTFGTDTSKNINKTFMKRNTRVIALVFF